jgi:hypothetical protein
MGTLRVVNSKILLGLILEPAGPRTEPISFHCFHLIYTEPRDIRMLMISSSGPSVVLDITTNQYSDYSILKHRPRDVGDYQVTTQHFHVRFQQDAQTRHHVSENDQENFQKKGISL